MTNFPSISLRKHYRKVNTSHHCLHTKSTVDLTQVPGEPEELTSTIVLTSPDRFYVDIRAFKKADLSNPIQWAFAGTSESVRESNGRCFSTWHHWIDSQTDDPALDRGEMITQDDGDVLEKGTTVDPDTGEEESYEELWTDLPLASGSASEHSRICVVLRAEEVEKGMRGMVIRIGGWCQGIMKKNGAVSVERRQRVEHGETNNQDSKQNSTTLRTGPDALPCKHILELDKFEPSKKVDCGAFIWKVIEISTW
ncbi:MAG: hypothetical protein Q9173_005595 [Seirophora scorigena]